MPPKGSKKEKEVVVTAPVVETAPAKASGGKSGRGKCLRNIVLLCDTR